MRPKTPFHRNSQNLVNVLDAVCAALVAGLHCLELTTPLGTVNDGGVIWMPDTEKLAGIVVGGNGG